MIDEGTSSGGRSCDCGRPLRQDEKKRCPHCVRVRATWIKSGIAAAGTTALSVAVLVVTRGKAGPRV